MELTVIIPDTADPKTLDAIAEAVHAAGGTVQPDNGAAPDEDDMGMPPGPPMPGAAAPGMVPPPPGMPLAAGPGAGMMPGAAMTQKGAIALRPRK